MDWRVHLPSLHSSSLAAIQAYILLTSHLVCLQLTWVRVVKLLSKPPLPSLVVVDKLLWIQCRTDWRWCYCVRYSEGDLEFRDHLRFHLCISGGRGGCDPQVLPCATHIVVYRFCVNHPRICKYLSNRSLTVPCKFHSHLHLDCRSSRRCNRLPCISVAQVPVRIKEWFGERRGTSHCHRKSRPSHPCEWANRCFEPWDVCIYFRFAELGACPLYGCNLHGLCRANFASCHSCSDRS